MRSSGSTGRPGKVLASILDGGACTIVAATDTDVCASGGDGDGCATGIVHISATTNVVVDTLGTGVLLVASLVALRPHLPRSDAT